MKWLGYERPKELADALTLLEKSRGRGRLIAGGTDLVLQLQRGQHHVDLLVDITDIQGLNHIDDDDGWIRLGASVTHDEVAKHPLIKREAKALSEGCGQVGSPQIRNVATLVGNIVSAQPAADGAIPLMALDAELRVLSKSSERWIPLEEAYRGLGLSAVDATSEIVTEIRFRKLGENGTTGSFRMARRKSLTLPMVNGAIAIIFDPSLSRMKKVRIAIGPVAAKPYRAKTAESYLESVEVSPESISEAARIASEEAVPRSSLIRGSSAYRKEMIRLYLTKTFHAIVDEKKKGKKAP